MRNFPLSVVGLAAKARLLLGVLLLTGASVPFSRAATTVWNDTDGDFSWDNPDNWGSGIPTTTATAVFDTAGGGTIGNSATVGTDSAALIQFGLATETASPAAAAFTLASGTISMPDATGATIVNYLGAANTAQETINSNLVLGTATATGTQTFTVGNSSSGNVTLGAISLANTSYSTGTTYAALLALNVTTAVGSSVTLNGPISYQNNTAANYDLSIGTSATGTYGNVVVTNASALGTQTSYQARAVVYGTQGTLQFNTTGISALPYNETFGTRTAANPQFENITGTNSIGIVEADSANESVFIQSDAGTMTVGGVLNYTQATTTTFTIDGVGNGVLASVNDKYGTSLSLVKDGTGTWALGTSGTGLSVYSQNAGPAVPTVAIAGGTLLVDGTESAASSGTLTVTNTGTSAAGSVATLGGVGTIRGAVTVIGGGKINPGDVGTGAANIGTLTLAAGLTVGNSTSSGVLQFDLNSGASTADKIALTGALTLTSATLNLDDVGSATLANGTKFTLLTYTGILTGSFSNVTDDTDVTIGNNTYLFDEGSFNNSSITLTVTAVPEPATWLGALVLSGFAGVQILLRRRGART